MIVADAGVPVDTENESVKVSVINQQLTAFSELSVAQRDPEIQISAQYNSLSEVRVIETGSSTATATDGKFVATSGTGANDIAAIFTDRQIISRTGQGSEVIYTALFDTPVTDNLQQAGPATAMDAVFFCYDGLSFGVAYEHNGLVLIEELTITTPASGAESTTITIDGTGYTVPITAGTVEHNANEITESLESQVALFNFTQNEGTVVARAIFPFAETGAFSFSSPGDAEAAWSQVSDGRPRTVEITNQANWNGNQLSEPLDPQKLNRYKVVFNGSVDYYIEDGETGLYVLAHRRVHTNSETEALFSVSAFRIVWGSTNQGNTTNISVSGTEAAAFNQGEIKLLKGTKSKFNTELAVGLAATNIVSIRCREVFGTKVNLGRIVLKEVKAFTDGNKGAIVQVCTGVDFTGDTNFQYIDKISSITEFETTALPVTGGDCIASFPIGSAGGDEQFNNILLLPGEVVTVSMHVPSGAAADMDASVTWEEDI